MGGYPGIGGSGGGVHDTAGQVQGEGGGGGGAVQRPYQFFVVVCCAANNFKLQVPVGRLRGIQTGLTTLPLTVVCKGRGIGAVQMHAKCSRHWPLHETATLQCHETCTETLDFNQ